MDRFQFSILCRQAFLPLLLTSSLFLVAQPSSANELNELLEMPLSELLEMEVTSVSRREQNLLSASAAIYVITDEDLRRRAITNIPDALRMVPGIHVASIDGNKWMVSSRGYTGRFSNKLLVQVDGRSVYVPSYSGVYWDMQDLLISNIDRIEVIRGPGATLWGANAVNGVINIITKTAKETLGWQIEAGIGDQLKETASIRYGGKFADDIQSRFHLKTKNLASNERFDGTGDANDEWDVTSAGFRVDGQQNANDSWTIQGDITSSSEHQTIPTLFQPAPTFVTLDAEDTIDSSAWNLLGRWERVHDNQSVSQIQIYFDHNERDEIYLKQEHDTFDIDFQNQVNLNDSHHLVFGLGYRHVSGEYRNSYAVQIMPTSINLDLYSAFIQDEITVIPDTFSLILGSKVEYHEFTDFEVQPSIRAVWSVAAGHNLWGAISRAVRTPSIVENNAQVVANPFPAQRVMGNDEVVSETVDTYEIGYRYYGNSAFTLDLALFYNDYDNYISYEILSPTTIQMDNKVYGSSYGFELSTAWQVTRNWQLRASYSQLKLDMKRRGDSLDVTSVEVLNDSYAEKMLKLNSSLDFGDGWELDAWIYYVSGLKNPSSVAFINGLEVDSYWSTNLRLGRRISPNLEVSVVANNIFEDKHEEFFGEYYTVPTEIERSILAQVRWNF